MTKVLNPSRERKTMMIFLVTVFSLLLVLSTFTPVGARGEKDIDEKSLNKTETRPEVPTLEPGSSWTYSQERMVQMTPLFSTTQPREYVEMVEEVTYTVEGIEEIEQNGDTHTVYNISIDGDISDGGGQIDLEITSIDLNINGGYVEGYRNIRVSDFAVVKEQQYRFLEGKGVLEDLPIARTDIEIDLERNEEYSPPVETYNFPIDVGETFTTNHNLRHWGLREMRADDVGEYDLPNLTIPYDNDVDFKGDTEITGEENVGEFNAYHLNHVVDDGDYGEIDRWYDPEVNFHVKEEVDLDGSNWSRELIDYELQQPDPSNQLSIDSLEVDIGEEVTLNGQFPNHANEDVVIQIPTGGEPVDEWNVTTDSNGDFEKEITVPAAADDIIAQNRFSSVGLVANIEGQIDEYAVSTIEIHHDNSPLFPEPKAGAEDADIAPELKVFIVHNESKNVDVTFYDGDDEKIATCENVASGEYATAVWELFEVGTFTWYAVADDGFDTYRSEEWNLTTSGAFFDVSIEEPQPEEEFIEGDQVSVEYVVENVGDEKDTQDIEFHIDETVKESEQVELDPGASKKGEFLWETAEGDSGTYELMVLSEDYLEVGLEEKVSVTILQPTFFEIDMKEPGEDQEFEEGDTITVDYIVENSGEAEGEQEIVFKVNGDETENETIQLASGETLNQNFTWEAEGSGDYVLSIQSENDEDEVSISVVKPAFFQVEITTEYEEEIVEGDTVEIGFEVTNQGEALDTKEIELKINGEKEDAKEMEVSVGGSREDKFEWTAESSGDFVLEVSTEDSFDDVSISVLKEASFEVDMMDYEGEAVGGTTVKLGYEVTNAGEVSGEREIGLFVDGGKRDEEKVSLDGGEKHEGEFVWIPPSEGDYELELKSLTEDDEIESSDSQALKVLRPASFEIEITEYDEKVKQKKTVTVKYTVKNKGDVGDTQKIELKINGEVKDSEELELDAGKEQTGEFEWKTGGNDAGEVDLTVSSEDDEAEVTMTVEEEETPGFTFVLFVSAGIFAVALYRLKNKKK